ncbi:MAG TPA: outer membrane lipoprotein carrier protein LolA [Candidatus Cloacimonadota bacterium]|nr:outer membrane lipoprotein carrier protein LolA [Candidatus Cloacimonadota bacterium]HPS39335.1 outer membrane lipoprotein carrier protein LolA [Candidatus Cloacimonadota bacterium]
MKRYILITAILLLILSLGSVTAPKAIYTKLQSAYKGISSFQAAVSQTNYYTQMKKSITYSGNLYFTPGRMLMMFTKPQIQRLQIESGKITLYDGMSNTIIKSVVQPQFGRMNPVEVLQIYWGKSTVSVTKEDTKTVSVSLKPNKDPMLKSLSAVINKSSGLVQNLSYIDFSGNSVSYAFSGIKLNSGIAASVWNYSYPKNAQTLQR